MRYLFDLTTTAHWSGAPVGIIRVERELARRAREHLGSDLSFCVYDRIRGLVLTIDDEIASRILDGRLRINFVAETPVSAKSQVALAFDRLNAVRSRLRRGLRSNAAIYHAFQRLRGRSFTRKEIQRIQAEEFAPQRPTEAVKPQGPVPIADVPHHAAGLDHETLIISGGLDWDFKDMHALAALKQEHKFRYCTIVYDLIPILFPHLVVPELSSVLANYFRDLAWLADYVMCISENTRQDWIRYCGEHRTDAGPACAFPLGADLPNLDGGLRVDLPETLREKRFALFVSTIEARKNHRMLYEAWDRCIRSGKVDAERDRLVFVGRRGWSVDDLMRELSVNPATRDTIVVLNHVSDSLLRSLYEQCSFVVFPSLYEGYGLPLAEALAHGKPCISSNAGSLPEIGGDLVLRIDPKDTPRWVDAIAHYMRSSWELAEMAARIKADFQPVTWNQAATQFFSAIKAMGTSAPSSRAL